ncbi:MAG: hypothetical protein CMN78_02945 [Spirochaetales bacterium]|nr:hypothetical protein [Spirochaetales bacterium]
MTMTNFALLTTISFLVFLSGGLTGPISSLYLESLGAGYTAIGLIGTVAAVTAIASSYVWGRASDHLGRRKGILLFGLLTMAITNSLVAAVPSYGFIFPLRIFGGAALSAYATSSLALMGDELERHSSTRGMRMGIFRGLGSLAFGIMAFLSGSISDRFSLRAPFAMSAAFYFVAFFVALRIKEERTGRAATEPRRGVLIARLILTDARKVFLRGRRRVHPAVGAEKMNDSLPLAPLMVSAFLWSLVTGAVYAVWANYMVNELSYTQTAMSRLWSLASTSEFPLMIFAGWLSDKIGRLRTLILAFFAWTLVFAGYVLIPGMPWMVFIQLTRGLAYSAFTAAAMTYATEVRSRAKRGEVSGLYSASSGLGSILGASMGGIQTQIAGFRAMIGTNAAIVFGGAIYLSGVVFRRLRRKQPI